MKHEIKNRFSDKVIFCAETESYNCCVVEAIKQEVNLAGANLTRANLTRVNLAGANLARVNLTGAELTWANLTGAELCFDRFPSIRLISSFPLGKLSDGLTLELMRRDCYGHPGGQDIFTEWAEGGNCPYKNEERLWNFEESRSLWRAGDPQLRDSDLILQICGEKNWKIKGYGG